MEKQQKVKIRCQRALFALTLLLTLCTAGMGLATEPDPSLDESTWRAENYSIQLKSREFTPYPEIATGLNKLAEIPSEPKHMLVQFHSIPTREEQEALKAAGVDLLNYVPHKTWFVSFRKDSAAQALMASSVRWIGEIEPADKISPALRESGVGHWAVSSNGTLKLQVHFFKDVSQEKALQLLGTIGTVEHGPGLLNDYVVSGVDPNFDFTALAAEDIVKWVDQVPPPEKDMNDELRSRINADAVQTYPYYLNGTDVDVGEWDGGEIDSTHDDFGSRVTKVETSSVSSHATHVAGTVGGDGTLSASKGGTANQWRGVATNVDFYSYNYTDDDLEPEEHNGAINTYGIDLSQNSWGLDIIGASSIFGDYDSRSTKYDMVVRGIYGRGIPVIFSAGNDRNDSGECPTGYNCIAPPGSTSKNTITVGATNSDDDSMTTFSSWGPVDDGRLKPEVVAPGCEHIGGSNIYSTWPGDLYAGICGTSMAAPAVSGTAALIIQQYRTSNAGNDPLPSTVKALLVHGAVDLDDGTSYYNPGPDYASGYGRIDAQASVDLVQDGKVWEDVINATYAEYDWYCVNVTSSEQPLKVTLAWDDHEGAVNANPALVNDLDLRVYYGGKGASPNYYAWRLDPSNPSNNALTSSYNYRDPLEQVVVNNPTPGKYYILVWGWEVPEAPQTYSLVSEHFPFCSCDADPTLGKKIYWDVYHDSGSDSLIGNYSQLAAAASSWGLTIDEKNTSITTSNLNGYGTLVLPDPETVLSANEVAAINSFIWLGGRLIILGERSGAWQNVTPLSVSHGITFNPDTVSDPTNNEGAAFWPLISSFASHPLTNGLSTIALYAGSSLYLHGSVTGLAFGDLDTTSNEGALEEKSAAETDNSFAPDFIWPWPVFIYTPVVAAYSRFGEGDIVAIGDSGLWSNSDPDSDGTISLDEYDNKQFARNVFTKDRGWLSAIFLLLLLD